MYKITVRNFQGFFQNKIFERGKKYYKEKLYKKTYSDTNGNYRFDVYGTEDYEVSLNVSHSGEITRLSCTCPYDKGYCKHEAAVLLYIKSIFEKSISAESSDLVGRLIEEYVRDAKNSAGGGEQVRLVPELVSDYGHLKYTLKIGRNKLYVINNISDLYSSFRYQSTKRYGKELTLKHDINALDERSRKLLELTVNIYNGSDYMYQDRRVFELFGSYMEAFFALYNEDTLLYNGENAYVKFENPDIELKVKKTKTGRYEICMQNTFDKYFGGSPLCVFCSRDMTFYICSKEFDRAAGKLLFALQRGRMYVSEADMKAFYSAILKPVSGFLRIKGLELLEEYAPDELCVKLYLDYENGCARGKLVFEYGENSRPAFGDKAGNYACDFAGEAAAESAVKRYFNLSHEFDAGEYPLCTDGDDMLYNLISEGLAELSGLMEVFTTARFDRIAIRPPVRPTVGVRPLGGMLELEITAEGYTMEQLAEILKAYRQGKKFHRLKDGGFADIGKEMEEFSELAEGLNITDKNLKKEQLKVPAFRMLYLDSLAEGRTGLKINRSAEFKKKVRQYKEMLSYSDSITVPDTLNGVLREYQEYGYRWLETISAYGFGGILADDMGLGKTVQATAYMLNAKITSKKHITSLVVCPSSVMLNWESEIQKFASELKTVTIMGTASERSKLMEEMNEYDVAITSYSLMARDFESYSETEFHSVFIDEAQYIKNQATQAAKAVKSLNALHRFALTGTPVENSLAELWSIFDFIMPDYLYSYAHFKTSFENPIVKSGDDSAAGSLRKIVSPFILRRMKKDVLTELPDKTESALFIEMEEEQSKLYSANVASVISSAKESTGNESPTEKIKILAMLTKLRQICCDPSLVYENYKGGSAKLEQCLELINSCVESGHKILLFSQFTTMLDIISERLEEAEISHYMLTGSTKPRERITLVNCFNADDTKVFLISLKAGGTGLNLTGADIVIHYDPWWNSSAENQASDRAYRIGQKNNVQIYKMIMRGTIEEKIRELQQSKSELADIAVNGENASESNIMKMSVKDILNLLNN